MTTRDPSNSQSTDSRSAERAKGIRSYSPTQLFSLMRLSYLLKKRREYIDSLKPEDLNYKLLNKALYSTFCDCLEAGIGEEARSLLSQQQERN